MTVILATIMNRFHMVINRELSVATVSSKKKKPMEYLSYNMFLWDLMRSLGDSILFER